MDNIKKWEELDHWVEINLDLCRGAEDCVEICPVEVFDIVDGIINANNIGDCIDCMACQDICPYDAIMNHSAWQ